jgi:hypothetical protein
VRVTRTDSAVYELRHAQVAGDSLTGYARSAGTGDTVRMALPLAEVRRIEGRGRTAGAAIGLFFGGLLALAVAATIAAGGI